MYISTGLSYRSVRCRLGFIFIQTATFSSAPPCPTSKASPRLPVAHESLLQSQSPSPSRRTSTARRKGWRPAGYSASSVQCSSMLPGDRSTQSRCRRSTRPRRWRTSRGSASRAPSTQPATSRPSHSLCTTTPAAATRSSTSLTTPPRRRAPSRPSTLLAPTSLRRLHRHQRRQHCHYGRTLTSCASPANSPVCSDTPPPPPSPARTSSAVMLGPTLPAPLPTPLQPPSPPCTGTPCPSPDVSFLAPLPPGRRGVVHRPRSR